MNSKKLMYMHIIKKRLVLTALLAVVLTLFVFPMMASARVENINTGESFSSIQPAIDDEDTLNGHTLRVSSGTYFLNSPLSVYKSLTIESEDGAQATSLTSGMDDSVFEVTASGVTINGFTIRKATDREEYGIHLKNVENCDICNNILKENWCGIWLHSSSNNILRNNDVYSNELQGIRLHYSDFNTLTSNAVSNNDDGGILLTGSSDNTLRGNVMSGNTHNFGVHGNSLPQYVQSIDTSNKVDGKPIYYWVNQFGGQVPGDAGYVGIVDSTNIIVAGLTLTNNYEGVLFAYTDNSRIENTHVSNNNHGIHLRDSSHNTITSNNANSNDWYGICLISSGNNAITSNNANSNSRNGIDLTLSDYNDISHNTCNLNNVHGIYVDFDSCHNTITDNTVSDNWNGISLDFNSNYNTISNNNANSNHGSGISLEFHSGYNTITNNNANSNDWYGIELDQSSYNTIYLNNFINNNIENVHSDESYASPDTWRSPSKIAYTYNGRQYTNYTGNYWSDYTGSDADGDGIGDTAYSIHGDYDDNYPLMGHWEDYFAPIHGEPVETATGTGTAYFASDAGTLEDLASVNESDLPSEGKPEVEFSHGFFSFNITGLTAGQTVTVTITLPDNVPVGTQYWKYGKTADDLTDHWYEIPVGDNDGDDVITITLTDGGLGDDDLSTNGVIVDDGGPSLPSGAVPYVVSSDDSGAERNTFELTENIYCYAGNLPAGAVDIYVVADKDVWNDNDELTDVSGGNETETTGGDGNIANTKIWSATLTQGDYDIVVDTNRNGKWNTGEPIDSEVDVGFTAVPEFTTIAIPVAAVLGLVFLMSRRSKHSKRRN